MDKYCRATQLAGIAYTEQLAKSRFENLGEYISTGSRFLMGLAFQAGASFGRANPSLPEAPATTMCDGCGITTSAARCLGCAHVFGDEVLVDGYAQEVEKLLSPRVTGEQDAVLRQIKQLAESLRERPVSGYVPCAGGCQSCELLCIEIKLRQEAASTIVSLLERLQP